MCVSLWLSSLGNRKIPLFWFNFTFFQGVKAMAGRLQHEYGEARKRRKVRCSSVVSQRIYSPIQEYRRYYCYHVQAFTWLYMLICSNILICKTFLHYSVEKKKVRNIRFFAFYVAMEIWLDFCDIFICSCLNAVTCM